MIEQLRMTIHRSKWNCLSMSFMLLFGPWNELKTFDMLRRFYTKLNLQMCLLTLHTQVGIHRKPVHSDHFSIEIWIFMEWFIWIQFWVLLLVCYVLKWLLLQCSKLWAMDSKCKSYSSVKGHFDIIRNLLNIHKIELNIKQPVGIVGQLCHIFLFAIFIGIVIFFGLFFVMFMGHKLWLLLLYKFWFRFG